MPLESVIGMDGVEAASPPGTDAQAEEIRVLRVAEIILRRWKTIAGWIAIAVAVAVLIYVFQPERYEARVVLVPSTSASSNASPLLASELPIGLGQLLGRSDASEQLITAILESRSLVDSLESLVAGPDSVEQRAVRLAVTEHTEIDRNPDGSISVVVSDADAVRATEIANHFVTAINGNVLRISGEAAVRKEEFLQSQISRSSQQLEASEQALVNFQLAEDLPEVQEQARQTIETAAALQQAIIEQELQVAELRRITTPDHPTRLAAEAALANRRAQLSRLTSDPAMGGQIFVPLDASPELKVASTRLLREYAKNEQVYGSLTAALAETQIDANNNLPVVSVLDGARVPRSPSKINLPILFGAAILLGLAAGLVAAFGREFAAAVRRDPESESFFGAWDQLRADFRRLWPWRRASPGRAPTA